MLPRTWSGPAISGSSFLSGTKTVPPPLTVWSTPWSKNWPNSVNIELYGGERPTSVRDVRDEQGLVWQGRSRPTGGVAHGTTPSVLCDRTGKPAAAIAAGFVEVWSTIRLLMTRGSES